MVDKKGKNIAIGTLVGLGVGFVAGILTAPKSGKETREDIKTAAIKTKAQAEKAIKTLLSELNTLLSKGEELIKETKAGAQSSLSKAVSRAKLAKEQVREVLSALHEGDAEDKDLKDAITEATNAIDALKKFLAK